jgi:hypothetical protein
VCLLIEPFPEMKSVYEEFIHNNIQLTIKEERLTEVATSCIGTAVYSMFLKET